MAANDFDSIIALGSNIGDKAANIARAIARLEACGGVNVIATSPLYRTEPWGEKAQDWFVNACIGVRTSLTPQALLAHCLAVETEMGRKRTTRWGPRVIDLDILVFGNVQLATPALTLPHPRIPERAFVLAPLADIAPDLLIGGHRVDALLAAIDATGVERFHTRKQ